MATKVMMDKSKYLELLDIKSKYFQFQAEYEARLKADMVAMLEELLKELKELPKARFYETNEFDDVTGCIDYPAISKNALDLIQQKINELEEQRDETDKSNK